MLNDYNQWLIKGRFSKKGKIWLAVVILVFNRKFMGVYGVRINRSTLNTTHLWNSLGHSIFTHVPKERYEIYIHWMVSISVGYVHNYTHHTLTTYEINYNNDLYCHMENSGILNFKLVAPPFTTAVERARFNLGADKGTGPLIWSRWEDKWHRLKFMSSAHHICLSFIYIIYECTFTRLAWHAKCLSLHGSCLLT